jgi:hypothetical protein
VRTYLKKTHHKKGLVELLKVQALSSSPSTAKEILKIINGQKPRTQMEYKTSERVPFPHLT